MEVRYSQRCKSERLSLSILINSSHRLD
jgi:hypothetical protein